MKVPIPCWVSFMFCCGVSLGVDGPGQSMDFVGTRPGKTLSWSGDSHETTVSLILPL